jgi:ABC-2 type transport system ATP-binding protein/lipopolysaccharide transport system ATP-binding protein
MPTGSNSQANPYESNNSTAITLDKISVMYRVPYESVSGIKEYTIRWAQRRLVYKEFWALRDVSLQIQRGEIFGVIGHNGAGKSTLLKVIARVLHPTDGRVTLRGKVAPLLELGAGFHPELTGRENVFLNSALLGRSRREMERLLPEVVEFAEIGDFIDAPIRTYSTGMEARLGFSVATCARPDILLVDEVLSVGDAQFQQKCLDRINSFQAQGTTIILVSHGMAAIETYCERAMWLQKGRVEALGPASDVINQYVKAERSKRTNQRPSKIVAESPQLDSSSLSDALTDYTPLPEMGKLYPAEGILNVSQGSVCFWLKIQSDRQFKDTVIFHTDDSRFVIYISSYYSIELERDIHAIVTRAGGNKRALDTFFGTTSFPEVSAALDFGETSVGTSFPTDIWNYVTMTWDGYPKGKLRLYIGRHLIGEREYDSRFDNGQPLPQTIALGTRPHEWAGELIEQEDGTLVDSKPENTLAMSESNVSIQDLRLYQQVLSQRDIEHIIAEKELS